MRKITIHKWKAKMPNGEEVDESTLNLFSLLLSAKKPEELPKGMEKFRIFTRLANAFDKAEKDNILILEESEYSFLKKMLETDLISTWGMNQNIVKAVDLFLEAKEE